MKRKGLLLLSLVTLLFACGGGNTSEPISEETSVSQEKTNFDLFKDAITFKTNDAYTGYRLSLTIVNEETREQVYYLVRNLTIDNINNCSELTETITRIPDDINSDGESITEETHMYYTLGSIIVEQDDGRYVEKDGIITKSTGLPSINPTEDSFENLELNLTGNVLKMTGDIKADKANDLFAAEGLETMENGKMEASIYDDRLETVNWSYNQGGYQIKQNLTILYNSFTIITPAL